MLAGWLLIGVQVASAGGRAPVNPSIWIESPDGSLSCEEKSGESLDASAERLKKAGVKILKSEKGSDGRAHVMMCGAATGRLNRHLISAEDLEKAKKLGFQGESERKKEEHPR